MRARWLTLVCCLVGGLPVAAQGPKPGPEQEALKRFEGTWDVTVAFAGQESKGTSVYKLGYGGLWLTQDFVGNFGGQKFEGHGIMGYDANKKKYVGTWIDSMGPGLMVMEGEFANDGKTYTETGEGPGPDGKPTKMKSVFNFADNDSFTMTMSMVADGKEQESLKLTYRRKK